MSAIMSETSSAIFSNYTDNTTLMEQEKWASQTLYVIQLLMTATGLVSNLFTLAALVAIGRQFTPAIRLLLIHQAWVDSWVCGEALILLVQPYMWSTGALWFDTIVCHVWHSQTVFWGTVDVSVYGLVLIAFERYLSTCYPYKHLSLELRHLYAAIVAVNAFMMIILMAPSYFQASIQNGVCTTEFYFTSSGFHNAMKFYPLIIFIITYLIPCTLFIFFYGSILLLLHRRKKCHELGESEVIYKANVQILKTAIIVTVFFVVSLAFDKWYYTLSHLGLFKYNLNSPIQKIGVFMSELNSAINPFIYLIFLSAFRRRFYLWIQGRCRPLQSSVVSSNTNSSSERQQVKHTMIPSPVPCDESIL